jgi:hypothetical protein
VWVQAPESLQGPEQAGLALVLVSVQQAPLWMEQVLVQVDLPVQELAEKYK